MTQWHHWAPISTRNSSRFYRRIVVSNYKHSTCTMKELKSEWKRKKKFPIWVIKLANCWKKRFVPASPLINSEFSIHWKVVNIQNGGVKNNDEVFKSVNTWWSGLGLLVLYYLLIDSGTIAWKKIFSYSFCLIFVLVMCQRILNSHFNFVRFQLRWDSPSSPALEQVLNRLLHSILLNVNSNQINIIWTKSSPSFRESNT